MQTATSYKSNLATYKNNMIQFPTQKIVAPRNQTMEPIESREDVNKIIEYCLESGKIRDALLFVFGFNTGLRVSDLILVQVKDVLRDGVIVDSFRVKEIKTSRVKSKAPVTVYINEALRMMLDLYFKVNNKLNDDDEYLFTNQSYCSSGFKRGNYISRQTAWKIVKDTIKAVGIDGKYGTHTLRKTPSMQIMTAESMAEQGIVKNEAGLQAVQMFLNHRSVSSTFHYVGILERQLKAEVMRLNLGLEAIQNYIDKYRGTHGN